MKNLGGKGKLTNKTIDRLQNYYGIAMRGNSGHPETMKTAIHATLFHVASSKDNDWHDHCPSVRPSVLIQFPNGMFCFSAIFSASRL